LLTRASCFWRVRALSALDFPALERPAKARKGRCADLEPGAVQQGFDG
jgi:hypothetical protein